MPKDISADIRKKDRIPVKKSRSKKSNLIFIIMKTLNFKNMIPLGVIALGISGAFATVSMQSAPKTTASVDGYTLQNGACNIKRTCSDTPGALCKVAGNQAFGINEDTNNCSVEVYQP